MKKYFKKKFPNKKKFFGSIFFIFLFFFILIIPIKFFEQKKISEKKEKIEEILIWSIETYKEKFGEYPENLDEIEEKEIINKIEILEEKENIFYEKNGTGYILKLKK